MLTWNNSLYIPKPEFKIAENSRIITNILRYKSSDNISFINALHIIKIIKLKKIIINNKRFELFLTKVYKLFFFY